MVSPRFTVWIEVQGWDDRHSGTIRCLRTNDEVAGQEGGNRNPSSWFSVVRYKPMSTHISNYNIKDGVTKTWDKLQREVCRVRFFNPIVADVIFVCNYFKYSWYQENLLISKRGNQLLNIFRTFSRCFLTFTNIVVGQNNPVDPWKIKYHPNESEFSVKI